MGLELVYSRYYKAKNKYEVFAISCTNTSPSFIVVFPGF